MTAKTKRARYKVMQLSELEVNSFVRQELNHEHVQHLAELIKNAVDLPPPKITIDGQVIDGRHRIDAHEINGIKEIKCEIIDITDETKLISMAYQANQGGSLPPTQKDTDHTIMLLLDRGETIKSIGTLLNLPAGMARKYVKDVKSRMSRAKIQRAANDVINGNLTAAKSAEKHDVNLEQLKEMLSGKKRSKWGTPQIKSGLAKLSQSLNLRQSNSYRKLIEKYEDGDVTAKQVREVFRHMAKLQRNSAKVLADWTRRFEAKVR